MRDIGEEKRSEEREREKGKAENKEIHLTKEKNTREEKQSSSSCTLIPGPSEAVRFHVSMATNPWPKQRIVGRFWLHLSWTRINLFSLCVSVSLFSFSAHPPVSLLYLILSTNYFSFDPLQLFYTMTYGDLRPEQPLVGLENYAHPKSLRYNINK